jgi:hypothetical protein
LTAKRGGYSAFALPFFGVTRKRKSAMRRTGQKTPTMKALQSGAVRVKAA